MVLTHERKFFIVLLIISGTWASQAMCRTMDESVITRKHRRWMAHHRRTYENREEKERRFKIFKDNLEYIQNFNTMSNQTYTLSPNEFADLTHEEFTAYRTGYKTFQSPGSSSSETLFRSFRYENLTEVPANTNWTEKGAVTPVKYQDLCGKKTTKSRLFPNFSSVFLLTASMNIRKLLGIFFCRCCRRGHPNRDR